MSLHPCFYRTAGTLGRIYRRAGGALPHEVKVKYVALLLEVRSHLVPSPSLDARANLEKARPEVQDVVEHLCTIARRCEEGCRPPQRTRPTRLCLSTLLPEVPPQGKGSLAEASNSAPFTPECRCTSPAPATPPKSPFEWDCSAKEFVPGFLDHSSGDLGAIAVGSGCVRSCAPSVSGDGPVSSGESLGPGERQVDANAAVCDVPNSVSIPMDPGVSDQEPTGSDVTLDCGISLNADLADGVIRPLLHWSFMQWCEDVHCEPGVGVSVSNIDEVISIALERLDLQLGANGKTCSASDAAVIEPFVYAIAQSLWPALP
mmetsp:Transcript_89317/g.277754  ORF Transcript_89317/g.277754 Transcript_89317/m.277754 type:complete len:317 (-) Transcript_89317:123-1073(-)